MEGVVSCFRRSPMRGHRCRLEMYMHFNTLKFAPRDIYMQEEVYTVWLARANRVFHPSIFHSQISLFLSFLCTLDDASRGFFCRFSTCAVRAREIVFIFYDAFASRSLIPIKGKIILWSGFKSLNKIVARSHYEN